MEQLFGVLKQDGTTAAYRDRMFDFDTLQDRLESDELLAHGATYDAAHFEQAGSK